VNGRVHREEFSPQASDASRIADLPGAPRATRINVDKLQIWLKGLLAAGIAGAANGVITGFAAVGIDPAHFNLQAGFRNTLAIAAISAVMSALIGVAAYLKQSPLPSGS